MKTRATAELLANTPMQAVIAVCIKKIPTIAGQEEELAGVLWDIAECGASFGRIQGAAMAADQINKLWRNTRDA